MVYVAGGRDVTRLPFTPDSDFVMNEPAHNGNETRPGVPVIAMILLLIVAMVGGSFFFGGLIGPDPVQMFEKSGSPSVQIELKAASTVVASGFSNEMIDPAGKPLFISDEAGLTSADVKAAGVRPVDDNFLIELEFTEAGAQKLRKLSQELVIEEVQDSNTAPERLAILLDGKLHGAPVVRNVIDGGSAQIHLNELTKAEATRLAKGIVGAE